VRLLDQGFPFTVFAPTNDAFEALFDALGVSQAEAYLNVDLLRTVLRYHVIEESVASGDIEDGLEVESLQGSTLTFAVDGDVVMVNDATVVAADIEAYNGVIHVIDSVLVPAAPEASLELADYCQCVDYVNTIEIARYGLRSPGNPAG
jgi:uncharacterized surface protein with fasciclin (FAS1) repeats